MLISLLRGQCNTTSKIGSVRFPNCKTEVCNHIINDGGSKCDWENESKVSVTLPVANVLTNSTRMHVSIAKKSKGSIQQEKQGIYSIAN